MHNTTVAELIKGIQDMDRTLAMPKRTGLSKMRKADLVALHSEVLDHFLKVTQPEVDALHNDESVNESVDGAEIMNRWLELKPELQHQTPEWHRDNLASTPSPLREYQSSQEGLAVLLAWIDAQAAPEFVPLRTKLRQKQEQVISAPATGPQITVVAKVGRKLVLGVVIGTVTRPAMKNRNLVNVQHLGDDGQLLPRVTLHAANEVAA